MKAYSLIKINNTWGEVPYYLKNITLQEVFNYYFNWHTGQKTANQNEIAAWYRDTRGWIWEEI